MTLVVFLKGTNVGGRRTFKPGILAKELAAFDVVNIGAAGTFVARRAKSAAALRAAVLRKLPFEAEAMVCRGLDLLDLARRDPFPAAGAVKDARPYASILARRPRVLPSLPIAQPAGDDWQVKIIGISGPFALSLHRRLGRALIYPNEVVEKHLGVPATTRNWDTIGAICELLGKC